MNKVKTPRSKRRAFWMNILIILLLTVAFGQSQGAMAQGQWTANGNDINNTNSGNVGIGTTTPIGKLHLVDSVGSATTGDNTFRIESTAGTHGPSFRLKSFGGADYLMTATGSGNFGGAGAFRIYDMTGGATRFFIAPNTGNIGVGTTNPGAKLEVSGDVSVTGTGNINAAGTITGGNIVAKYQDMAEWVPSSQKLSSGTVVVLDQTKSNQVIASSQAYDTRVAGVISSQPGIALGEKGESTVLVATMGRVKVKVDATQGPINIGDLLVTGDKPGVAIKSKPVNIGGVQLHRPGTLIGKALECLATGQREILVLLSLQ